jgi:hypothetical protein
MLAVYMSAGATAALLSATPALAQSMPQVAAGRLVSFKISGRALYDSNAARGNATVANLRSLRKDEIIYTPTAEVMASKSFGGQALFLAASAGYDFHQYNTILDAERLSASAGIATRIGPCGPVATASYARRQSELEDVDLATIKNTQTSASVGAQIGCSVGASISPFVGIQYATIRNSGLRAVDSDVTSVSGGVRYQSQAIGIIELTGGYGRSNYETPTLVSAPTPDYESYNLTVQVSRPIGSRLKGRASLGAQTAKPIAPNSDSYRGITGSGALDYQVNGRLSTSISYERGVTPTLQEGSSYALSTSIQAGISYAVSQRIRANAGARWSKRSYQGETILLANRIDDDRVDSIFASLVLTVGRDGNLSLDVRRDVRETNISLFDYTAYRVGLTASKQF